MDYILIIGRCNLMHILLYLNAIHAILRESVDYKAMSFSPTHKYARLNHYYTKSTEEYANKAKRGEVFGLAKWDEKRKKFKYDLYYYYNKKTKEKDELLRKVLDMTL